MSLNELKQRTSDLVFWPSPQDYSEAMQNPEAAFEDPELRNASVVTDALGLPRPILGGFASVYHLQTPARNFAVRCFLHRIPDQQTRYALISDFLSRMSLDCIVSFHYIERGIKIRGSWFPVLKMEWVEGDTLDRYIEKNLDNPKRLEDLTAKFETMCCDLKSSGIAHGDLQHGNILVTSDGQLRIVDYDGMFVPTMQGLLCTEQGHRNYQHPRRSTIQFNRSLDDFSILVISLSLSMLTRDPTLYAKLNADDSLLLKSLDFAESQNSSAFELLESHADQEVGRLARLLRWQCTRPPELILALSELPAEAPPLEPICSIAQPESFRSRVNDLLGAPTLSCPKDLPPWWQWLFAHPELIEGIEPELLTPYRKVRFRYVNLVDFTSWGPPILLMMVLVFVASHITIAKGVMLIFILGFIYAGVAGPLNLLFNLVIIMRRLERVRLFHTGRPGSSTSVSGFRRRWRRHEKIHCGGRVHSAG